MNNQENLLGSRLAKLVQENQELNQELMKLREWYRSWLLNNRSLEKFMAQFIPQGNDRISDKQISQKFDIVTVLLADVHGFEEIKPEMDAEQLIDHLDQLMFGFDEITQNHNLKKIKTIGDSYMCAGGIPNKNITNPIEVVLSAFEMLQLKNTEFKDQLWEVRLAVHTGPVNAFVNGKNKISYDIKGDTVNIASRIESAGKNGHLIISVMTYELIKEFFNCEYYGKLPVKYSGLLDLYLVEGIKQELSLGGEGKKPNALFHTKLTLIQFHDLQEIILDKLEKELPPNLYYHNVKHTVDVVTEVELIGSSERVSDEDMILLKTAALLHDIGHIRSYTDHEHQSTIIARELLPNFRYSTSQIDKICELIMSTKMPPHPRNRLEEIICDADLDYLGRSDYIPVAANLFKELKTRNLVDSEWVWNKRQIDFISNHQYYTLTARRLREVNKQNQIERIKQLLHE